MTYKPYAEHEVIGDFIIFKEIVHDACADNPLENCDCMGRIFSFNSRHVNSIDREQLDAYREEYGEDLVLLSYFEHGLCKWGVQGSMGNVPDFQWDGVGMAGIWVPDEGLLEEAKECPKNSDERKNKMVEWAKGACEEYTRWCNGEVYGVVVRAYKARRRNGHLLDRQEDYRNDTPVFDESCWGYYGEEYAEEVLETEFLPWARKAVEEEAA